MRPRISAGRSSRSAPPTPASISAITCRESPGGCTVGQSTGADPYGQGRENPYGGITPETRFELMERNNGQDITLDRLQRRYSLKEQLDQHRRDLDSNPMVQGYGQAQQLALNLLTSEKLRSSLDIQSDPMTVREAYGMTQFGHATMATPPLVEVFVRGP